MYTEITSEIKFRCPSCQKLYCSDQTAFSENAIEPSEFDCAACHASFFLFNARLQNGLFKTDLNNDVSFQPCPKCDHLKPHKQDECTQCGVIESQFIEMQKIENPRLHQLENIWKSVLTDLMSDDKHQEFLNKSQDQMALNFAASKYQSLKMTMGLDPLVEKYLSQIELRLEHMVQARFNQEKENQSDGNIEKVSLRTKLQNFSSKDFFLLVGCVGTLLLIYNKIWPTFPNLTGLVVAITLMSYGVSFISQKNKTI